MTPAAIRAAEGPALDAFVLERVCGWRRHMDEGGGLLWNGAFNDRPCQYFLLPKHAEVSTDNAACWRWVVPALIAKGCGVWVMHDDDTEREWRAEVYGEGWAWAATAPTPALAIVRAAALTVAEGGE